MKDNLAEVLRLLIELAEQQLVEIDYLSGEERGIGQIKDDDDCPVIIDWARYQLEKLQNKAE